MECLRTLREWSQRLWGALHFGRRDRDLEEELRLHLELAADEARRLGVQDDSMRLSRIRAGGEAQAMDLLRDQRGLPCSRICCAMCATTARARRARASPRW